MSEQEYDKEQLRIMRNAFKAFDHDEKGFIDHSDVIAILEILGQKLDDKATKALIKEVDKKNSGRLDFNQFCRLASRFVEVEEDVNALANELKEAFRVYDKEGKGYLTVQTLRDILRELDDKLSKDDLDMIIEEIDSDGSGTVDFDEFMQVMTGKNFYDFTWQRRFVFDPHTPSACPSRCCYSAPRMRLHRRIECHFERFFQQMHMWQPFQIPKIPRSHITACSNKSTICSSTLALGKSPTKATVKADPVIVTKKTSNSCKTTATTLARCYCRPIFRPRFPKWVPILTLYREIVQNPFRRRGHYLLEHF